MQSEDLEKFKDRTFRSSKEELQEEIPQELRIEINKSLQKNISENAYKKFEEIREEIIGKQSNLLRAHANPPDDDDEKEITEKLFGTSFKFDTED